MIRLRTLLLSSSSSSSFGSGSLRPVCHSGPDPYLLCAARVLISISVCHSVLPGTPVRICASCLQSGPWCLRPVCHSGLGPYVLSATRVQVPVSFFLSLGSGSLVPVCLPGPDPCILPVARVRDPASCLPTGSVSLHPVCHLGPGRCGPVCRSGPGPCVLSSAGVGFPMPGDPDCWVLPAPPRDVSAPGGKYVGFVRALFESVRKM